MAQQMAFFDVPPVRHFGSKWQIAEWIYETFPPHEIYVEPFCGSAAVFFRKPTSRIEVLNDLNGDLVHFFRVLRTRRDELVQAVDLTPYAREEYELSHQPCEDELERARRFYVRSQMSFAADGRTKSGWRTERSTNRHVKITDEWRRLAGLMAAANRLKDAQIECRPALKVIRTWDGPNTLFYVDPPYVLMARGRKTKRYHHEMTDDDHRELAIALKQVQGAVVLSGYSSALYEELYPGWRTMTKTTTTNGNKKAVECLWLSPKAIDLQAMPIFKAQ